MCQIEIQTLLVEKTVEHFVSLNLLSYKIYECLIKFFNNSQRRCCSYSEYEIA